ncbi:DUF1652 domain-containing protein [Pseudomonas sp.]
MISVLELRHMIECGFLPLSCTCSVNVDGSLTIKVYEPSSGRVDLLVASVTTKSLASSRAIANLIGELRAEIAERAVTLSSCNSNRPLKNKLA